MSLVTTCPSCGTIFRMVREQLDASDGWVRCGHCMEVFDAKTNLSNDLDDRQSIDSFGALPSSDLSFVQQAQKKAFWSRHDLRLLLALFVTVLTCSLLAQVLRRESDTIAVRWPSLLPLEKGLCQLLTCTPPLRRQIEAWVIENSSFQKDSLFSFRLSIELKNTSQTTLLLPHVELSLLDGNDSTVVRRIISLSDAADHVPASGERKFSLRIASKAGQQEITGYRLIVFYP